MAQPGMTGPPMQGFRRDQQVGILLRLGTQWEEDVV